MPVLNFTFKEPLRIVLIGSVLLILLGFGIAPLNAETPVSKEYQVKAAFLFNFAQFVKWPSTTFAKADEPFRIGILGDDPFDDFLDETVKGEKVEGHPLVIQRYSQAEDIKDCQILFVSRSENARMAEILAGLKGRSILTVGDIDGFIKNGGVIRFVTEENRVHFKVNLEAAKSVKLAISSQMLRLAEIAKPGED